MLPWLPIPGNRGFGTLTKGLNKYGLSPRSFDVESPTNRLDDFVLVMSLSANRFKLKLSWGWFEFLVSNLYEGDDPSLIEIANVLFATLGEIDSEMIQTLARYQSYTHLKLAPATVKDVLQENLGSQKALELDPDAFAYNIKWKELKDGESARIVVAPSSRIEDGLFVDLAIEYVSPSGPASMIERMNKDYDRALSLLGLHVS
jgi:hypothetical protein